MTRDFAPRGPAEILDFLATKREELDTLDTEIQEHDEIAEQAEIDWTRHFDLVMEELESTGEKLPGEDKCLGLARRKGGWEMWIGWRGAERKAKRLKGRQGLIGSQISAAQSEAKLMGVVQ